MHFDHSIHSHLKHIAQLGNKIRQPDHLVPGNQTEMLYGAKQEVNTTTYIIHAADIVDPMWLQCQFEIIIMICTRYNRRENCKGSLTPKLYSISTCWYFGAVA